MATQKGVWNIQQVRDKQLQDLWNYSAFGDTGTLWSCGYNNGGDLGQNNRTKYSSPVQIPGTWSERPWIHQEPGGTYFLLATKA